MAKAEKVPAEVVEVVRKVLEQLNKIKDKLPKQAVAAMGILASLIGYGKQLKEELNEQELRVVMDQLALVEDELDGKGFAEAFLPADLIQSIKALVKGLIMILRKAGYPYAYPYYKPPSGYGPATYYSPFPYYQKGYAAKSYAPAPKKAPAKAKEAPMRTPEPASSGALQASVRKIIEGAQLIEAVDTDEEKDAGLVWKIQLIEAGLSKNRKLYRPEILQAAIPLFEGCNSYADHPPVEGAAKGGLERSIRDLAGWVTNVEFIPEGGSLGQGAVVGIYNALKNGPIAGLLLEAWQRGKPDLVQFSILGEGKQRIERNESGQLYFNVEAIDRIFSLDAVPEGAAGGRVQALIASVQEEVNELDAIEKMTLQDLAQLRPDLAGALVPADALKDKPPEPVAPVAEPGTGPTAVTPSQDLGALTEEVRRMQSELAMANRQRLLSERLSQSGLPDPVRRKLKEDFTGRFFEPDELEEAVKREEGVWKDIMREKPKVQTVTIGETKRDRYSDAVYGMLMGEDVNGVPRFHSIHQAYCAVKGLPFDTRPDIIADGLIQEGIGYEPGKQLRESPGSIAWTLVFGDAMQRKLVKDYQIPAFDDWRKIISETVDLPHFKTQRSERTGYYSTLPTVAKGGTYQSLTSPGEQEATYDPAKRGGLEDWTWEDALNDDLGALKKIPKKLALAAKITLYQFVFDFLRLGSATATTYDGANLFNAAPGTHLNLAATALSSAALTQAKIDMRMQTALSSGVTYLAIKPRYLVIPNELEALAIQLRDSGYDVPAAGVATSTQVANPHKGTFEIIVVDYWTTANHWYLVADPNLVPTIELGFLGGREEPELLTLAANTGSGFTADKVFLKVRHVFGGAPLDHRGLYASEP